MASSQLTPPVITSPTGIASSRGRHFTKPASPITTAFGLLLLLLLILRPSRLTVYPCQGFHPNGLAGLRHPQSPQAGCLAVAKHDPQRSVFHK